VKLVYAHDGYEFYDSLFVKSLQQRHDTCFMTFHPNPNQIPDGIEIVKMPDLIPPIGLYPLNGVRKHILTLPRAATFKKYVSKLNADVIVASWATTYGVYAAYSNRHPFVLLIWGSDVLILPKFSIFRALAEYALKKADIVVLDCDFQKKAAEKLGCQSSKILTFPWYDPRGIETDIKQKPMVRNELGFSEDDIIIVSIRKHDPIYGVNYLIEAIPLILRREPRAKFLVLGKGRLTSQFKKRIRKHIEEGNVKFLGDVPHKDVIKYLNISDIYISTSLSDGTSASLLEAMTCSLPPVVTSIPANKEWIQDRWNGFLIPTRNVPQLVQKIVWLAKNEELRLETGKNALETIRTRVNWQRSMETLNNAIVRCYNRASN
jgi:glycosyltransferase involved in cell wall biosynthesis